MEPGKQSPLTPKAQCLGSHVLQGRAEHCIQSHFPPSSPSLPPTTSRLHGQWVQTAASPALLDTAGQQVRNTV